MHAIICVAVKFLPVLINSCTYTMAEKMEIFKGCNHFPDFLCLFQTDSVERKITALENITFCVPFNLSFGIN